MNTIIRMVVLAVALATASTAQAQVKWLFATAKEYLKSLNKLEKTDLASKAAGDVSDGVEFAFKVPAALELYNERRKNPGAILGAGKIQDGQKKMSDAFCAVTPSWACGLADGVTKGAATLGEFSNLSHRHDQAASNGATLSQRNQALVASLQQAPRERANIVAEFQKPLRDRDGEVVESLWASASLNADRLLKAFGTSVGEAMLYAMDGSTECGDMQWYLNVGKRCKTDAEREAETQVGMRAADRDRGCFPAPRDLQGFADFLKEGDTILGCRITHESSSPVHVLLDLACSNGEKPRISFAMRSDNRTIRHTYLGQTETNSIDYEPCEMAPDVLDCSPEGQRA